MQYSLQKGLWKGIVTFLTVAGAWVAFIGFSDVSLWGIVENYLKPVIGSMTVGSLITIVVNYLKIRSQSA